MKRLNLNFNQPGLTNNMKKELTPNLNKPDLKNGPSINKNQSEDRNNINNSTEDIFPQDIFSENPSKYKKSPEDLPSHDEEIEKESKLSSSLFKATEIEQDLSMQPTFEAEISIDTINGKATITVYKKYHDNKTRYFYTKEDEFHRLKEKIKELEFKIEYDRQNNNIALTLYKIFGFTAKDGDKGLNEKILTPNIITENKLKHLYNNRSFTINFDGHKSNIDVLFLLEKFCIHNLSNLSNIINDKEEIESNSSNINENDNIQNNEESLLNKMQNPGNIVDELKAIKDAVQLEIAKNFKLTYSMMGNTIVIKLPNKTICLTINSKTKTISELGNNNTHEYKDTGGATEIIRNTLMNKCYSKDCTQEVRNAWEENINNFIAEKLMNEIKNDIDSSLKIMNNKKCNECLNFCRRILC